MPLKMPRFWSFAGRRGCHFPCRTAAGAEALLLWNTLASARRSPSAGQRSVKRKGCVCCVGQGGVGWHQKHVECKIGACDAEWLHVAVCIHDAPLHFAIACTQHQHVLLPTAPNHLTHQAEVPRLVPVVVSGARRRRREALETVESTLPGPGWQSRLLFPQRTRWILHESFRCSVLPTPTTTINTSSPPLA